MTTPLATVDLLASRLKLDDISALGPAGQDAIDQASTLLRKLARQEFSFVSQETVILSGNERVLTLPERPLVKDDDNPLTVIEVGEFGGISVTMVEDRDFTVIGNELKRGYPWWWNTQQRLMGYPRTRPLGVWAPKVQVTYSHGEQTVGYDVQSMVCDIAAVLWDNPTGIRSFSVDDYSETKAVEVLGAALYQSIRDKLGMTGRRRRAFAIRTA